MDFPQCVEGLQRMEKAGGVDTVQRLKRLESLLTNEAREEAASIITAGCTAKEYDRAMDRIIYNMWVNFHWSAENPIIHPRLGMHVHGCNMQCFNIRFAMESKRLRSCCFL